jgi:hypothetical protein
MRRSVVLALALLIGAAANVHAQASRVARQTPARPATAGNVTVVVTGGASLVPGTIEQSFTVPINAEPAPVAASLTTDAGPFVEGGLRLHLTSRLTIGAVAFYSRSAASGHVVASVPHPFYFGQLREVEGDAEGLVRREYGAHVEIGYPLTILSREVRLFAGPSFFHVERALITSVAYADAYPFDTAVFTGAVSATVTGAEPGFNVGAESTWRLGRAYTVAALARYSRATMTLPGAGGSTAEVTAGGIQIGLGVRATF